MTITDIISRIFELELSSIELKNRLDAAENEKELLSRKLLNSLERETGERDGMAVELKAGSSRFVAIVHKRSDLYNAAKSIEFKPLLESDTLS